MNPKTLNCPTCGASLSSDETRCRYCSSRLATISCPKCFGMMFVGGRFCPHCGGKAEQPVPIGPALLCPDCNTAMKQILLSRTPLQECERCHGLWVDSQSFERICADSEKQAEVLGDASPEKRGDRPAQFRYRPCPQCKRLMNRYNFAHISGIVIDVCKFHGVWFDCDELRRIVEFVRAGGMTLSQHRRSVGENEKQREAQAQERVNALARAWGLENTTDDGLTFVLSLARGLGRALGRRL